VCGSRRGHEGGGGCVSAGPVLLAARLPLLTIRRRCIRPLGIETNHWGAISAIRKDERNVEPMRAGAPDDSAMVIILMDWDDLRGLRRYTQRDTRPLAPARRCIAGRRPTHRKGAGGVGADPGPTRWGGVEWITRESIATDEGHGWRYRGIQHETKQPLLRQSPSDLFLRMRALLAMVQRCDGEQFSEPPTGGPAAGGDGPGPGRVAGSARRRARWGKARRAWRVGPSSHRHGASGTAGRAPSKRLRRRIPTTAPATATAASAPAEHADGDHTGGRGLRFRRGGAAFTGREKGGPKKKRSVMAIVWWCLMRFRSCEIMPPPRRQREKYSVTTILA